MIFKTYTSHCCKAIVLLKTENKGRNIVRSSHPSKDDVHYCSRCKKIVNKMGKQSKEETKQISLNKKLSDLNDKLYNAQLDEHRLINNMGWGHGMRCVKTSISTTRTDNLKKRIEKAESEIKELKAKIYLK